MSPAEEHEAASKELRAHELKHLKIQTEYNASLSELRRLNQAAADAWRKMHALKQTS